LTIRRPDVLRSHHSHERIIMDTMQQMHTDEFIGEVIVIGRLDKLHIDIDYLADMDERANVTVELTFPPPVPGMGPSTHLYVGQGRTMGYALRDAREAIRQGTGE